jgi:hypothetical protein
MLRDELAGKLIRCPQCGGVVEVVIEVVEPAHAVDGAEELQAASRKGPPPLPAMPPLPALPAVPAALAVEVVADDDELVEVVAVEEPPQPPEIALPPAVQKEEAYAAAPPLPVKQRRHAVPKQRRKKQSVYTEMYGDEPAHYGLYRESRFLQNCVIGGIIGLLVVGLGVAIWSGGGVLLIILVVVLIVGALGLFFGLQDWWYW